MVRVLWWCFFCCVLIFSFAFLFYILFWIRIFWAVIGGGWLHCFFMVRVVSLSFYVDFWYDSTCGWGCYFIGEL